MIDDAVKWAGVALSYLAICFLAGALGFGLTADKTVLAVDPPAEVHPRIWASVEDGGGILYHPVCPGDADEFEARPVDKLPPTRSPEAYDYQVVQTINSYFTEVCEERQ